MFSTILYGFSRLFSSIFLLLTIGLFGLIVGYGILFPVLILSWILFPWPKLVRALHTFIETLMCYGIRVMLNLQPWLASESNLPGIWGFYENFPTRKLMFICNHRSNLDTFLMISYVPGLAGLAKSSLFKNFAFAPFMRMMGFIPVDKGSPASLLSGLDMMKEQILDRNRPVLIFPENTRCTKGFSSVNKFSGSFFSLAIESGALIVPVAIRSTDDLLGRGDLLLNPFHRAKLQMLEPIPADQFKDFMQLRDFVHDKLKAALA